MHNSGQTSYTGSITKQGSKWLRWALVEAAQHAYRRPPFDRFYQRLKARRGPKIAKVAVVRKLCATIYHMLIEEKETSLMSVEGSAFVGQTVGVMV